MRASKRLQKIKTWIDSQEIKTREDMRRCVAADYKRAINMQLADGDDETNDDIRNVVFDFKFKAFNM